MTDYVVIESDEAFVERVPDPVRRNRPVAVDAERASGFRYSQRAYLIQLFRRGSGTFLFDPTAIDDLRRAAGGDRRRGVGAARGEPGPAVPARARAGPRERLRHRARAPDCSATSASGLAAVVERAARHRPRQGALRGRLVDPAAAERLAGVRRARRAAPASTCATSSRPSSPRRARRDFAAQEFEATRTRPPKPPREEPWRRLSGLHQVRGAKNLAVARELWQAREDYARETDVSPGRLVPDRALIAAVHAPHRRARAHSPPCRRSPAGPAAASSTAGGRPSNAAGERRICRASACRATLRRRRARGPTATRRPTRRLKAARAAVAALAEELGMPAENLLTPETLRRVAWEPPAVIDAETIGAALAERGARPWQIAATAQRIADAFVEAAQTPPEPSERGFVGSAQPIRPRLPRRS